VFALAYALGATVLSDTYTLANETPNMVFELVIGGVLSGMVLPEFVRQLRKDDQEEGWRAVSAVVTISLVACAALAVAFVFIAPWIIRLYTLRKSGNVGDDQLAVATDLLRLFAPQVFFYGTVYLSTAILRAQRRFAAPMFAPVLNNLVVIALFLSWPTLVGTSSLEEVRNDSGAILLLGLGTTAGVAAMALAQLPLRTFVGHVRWVWDPRHPSVVRILRLGTWTAGFVVANMIALFVVRLLANGEAGGVVTYFFAYTLFLLPHGIVSVSIISTLQPELAEAWAAGDTAAFRHHLGTGLRSIWAVMVPAAVGYVLLARPLVSTLLEHGALGADEAADVASTLAMFALGLPAFSSWMFLSACYQAMQDTRSLFFLYLLENGVNIAGALVLYAAAGVEGLALAFSLAYLAGTAAALRHLRRRLGGLEGRRLLSSAARVAGAAAVMGVAVAGVSLGFGSDRGGGAALRSGIGVVTGVTVFLVAGRLLGVTEMTDLLGRRGGEVAGRPAGS